MSANEEQRLVAFTRLLAASVLCCLAFSWKLWLSRPYYPLAPLFDLIPPFPPPFDYAFLGLLVALLLGVTALPRLWILHVLVLAVLGLMFFQDQNRLWPSFYQFFFLFLLLTTAKQTSGKFNAERVLTGMRFVIAMIYVWGGVHKLNPHFFNEEFLWFVEPVTSLLPFHLPSLPTLGVFAALFEVLIGVGLLTRRFRNMGLCGAVFMHFLIFYCIGPLRDQWNNSSWIWGLTVALQTLVLFYRAPSFDFKTMFSGSRYQNIPQLLAVVFIGFIPVLNNVNCWDSALSFNVYSGNVHYAEIHMRADAVQHLPQAIAGVVEVGPDVAVLVLNHWSLSEFNANSYPETRIYISVLKKICSYLPDNSARLYVREKSGWFFPKTTHRYDCDCESRNSNS